jgi:hypothetical protein
MQGSVYGKWLNRTHSREREFAVCFIPYETIDGATVSLKFLGEEFLRRFCGSFAFTRNEASSKRAIGFARNGGVRRLSS